VLLVQYQYALTVSFTIRRAEAWCRVFRASMTVVRWLITVNAFNGCLIH
jgi:hypothetical protein